MSDTQVLPDHPLRNLKYDLPAGIVVFLVAIPLCLGIAMASGAPPLSGLLAGIVGGLVVTLVSGSALSVSGPAAGLVVIVIAAIESLGFDGLLMATVIAGILQIIFGYLRLGRIGAFVPSSVIKGMLAAIGLILIVNQLPLMAGIAQDAEVGLFDTALFEQGSGLALTIALVSLAILLLWERPSIKGSVLGRLPAPLVAVVVAVLIDRLMPASLMAPLGDAHRIGLPIDAMGFAGASEFLGQLQMPALDRLLDPEVYMVAVTLALIASLESLLSLEAVDKIDPQRRHSPPHRELKAQGVGNLLSGLIGGLPVTAVIVRSSANVQAGGRTRMASLVHGLLLLASVALLAPMLELMPLACLAAILVHTGYKLAKPEMLVEQYRKGFNRVVPFVATVVGVMAMDLLKGVLVGILCGLFFMIRANYRRAVSFTQEGHHALLRFRTDISFLNREEVRSRLERVAAGTYLIIDARQANHVDPDIREDIEAFARNAPARGISVELRDVGGLSATFPADPDVLRELEDPSSTASTSPQRAFG